MKKVFSLVAVILLTAVAAAAQTEAELKRYFEGTQVVLKIDMPATKDGVNIYPERAQALNYGEYATRLKRHGTAIRSGEPMMVTKVKVKGKHLEFQLGALPGGSRFNIHFGEGAGARRLTPEGLIEALSKYVDFSNIEGGRAASDFHRTSYRSENALIADPRIIRLGPPTTYLREGLSKSEVVRLLGQPASVSERRDGDRRVTTYVYPRSEGRTLLAEFVDELLINSRTEIRDGFVRAEVPGN